MANGLFTQPRSDVKKLMVLSKILPAKFEFGLITGLPKVVVVDDDGEVDNVAVVVDEVGKVVVDNDEVGKFVVVVNVVVELTQVTWFG